MQFKAWWLDISSQNALWELTYLLMYLMHKSLYLSYLYQRISVSHPSMSSKCSCCESLNILYGEKWKDFHLFLPTHSIMLMLVVFIWERNVFTRTYVAYEAYEAFFSAASSSDFLQRRPSVVIILYEYCGNIRLKKSELILYYSCQICIK